MEADASFNSSYFLDHWYWFGTVFTLKIEESLQRSLVAIFRDKGWPQRSKNQSPSIFCKDIQYWKKKNSPFSNLTYWWSSSVVPQN